MPPITIAQWDDWVAVYLGDECVYQGHSIDGEMMLDTLGIAYTKIPVEGEDAWELCRINSLSEFTKELEAHGKD